MANIQLGGSVGVAGSVFILGNSSPVMPADANYTLATSEYSTFFLDVTSSVSLTATRNVVAPLNPGQTFLVQNNTTGGQSIQIIGSSGTGAVVLNGAEKLVACDGVNYFLISSGSSAPTADTFTPTSGQTAFTITHSPNGLVQMFVNGVAYENGVDFTVSGTTATWSNGLFTLSTTDTVMFVYVPAS